MSSMMRKHGSFWKRNSMTSMKIRFINLQVSQKRNIKYGVDQYKYTFCISIYTFFEGHKKKLNFSFSYMKNIWRKFMSDLEGVGVSRTIGRIRDPIWHQPCAPTAFQQYFCKYFWKYFWKYSPESEWVPGPRLAPPSPVVRGTESSGTCNMTYNI